jgi:molecular chaperone Hsp33
VHASQRAAYFQEYEVVVNDQLQKFMFNSAPVRGEIVSLHSTWREVLVRRSYPAPIRALLGEMMAAAALLSANLKFDGALVMQIHGDGPVKMLVVQCNSDLTMRATAKVVGEIDAAATLTELVNRNGGGRCAITLDPAGNMPGQQPYQGVVPLSDENGPLNSMALILEQYMRRSEQLDTRLWLAADDDRAVGMLLQKLPGDGGIVPHPGEHDADTWDRVCHLSGTLTQGELLDLDSETLLRRLFWQENVRRFEPAVTRFMCSCSRSKVGSMLRMLGHGEVDSIVEERGDVEVHCEFCNQRYEFDPVDVAQLFAADAISAGVSQSSGLRH